MTISVVAMIWRGVELLEETRVNVETVSGIILQSTLSLLESRKENVIRDRDSIA